MSEHILQFFAHAHLPPPLAAVSKPFGDAAVRALIATDVSATAPAKETP